MKVGDQVQHIRIVDRLGAGGMGEVFVGFDETLQRRVALKTLHGIERLGPQARARFLREARILSQLDHPSICRIYDYLSTGDDELLVLELIDGRTLDRVLEEDDLDRQRRLEIALEIAEVLTVAHGAGIVHRDLKPGNVMITDDGQVKVLDFGLARTEMPDAAAPGGNPPAAGLSSGGREVGTGIPPGGAETLAAAGAEAEDTEEHVDGSAPTLAGGADPDATAFYDQSAPSALLTTAGQVMGTPVFMSPEQARGEEVTTASDMYSFGLLLQWLFTGRSPYPPELRGREVMRRAASGESLPPEGLDSHLTALIEALKNPAPAARPTAVETRRGLAWIRDKPKRRLRRLAAAAIVLLVALGVTKYTVDLEREREAAVAAQELAERRRGQAEDLIGFMLGDLRGKLEPLGRLEILHDVGEEAMEYFAAVDEAELSDEELASRSRALYQIGEVRIHQGDLAAAEAPLRESLELARALAERHPDDGERLFELGQAHFWVGFVHWRRGELEQALEQFESYLDVSRRLVAMDPENLPWKLELAYAHSNIGSIHQARGELEEALEQFREALELKQALSEAQPDNADWQFDLARTHNTVGYVEEQLGSFDAALRNYRAETAIKEELVHRRPGHLPWRYELAIARVITGRLRSAMGAVEDALALHREAAAALEELVAEDPTNSSWARELAVARRHLGSALAEQGDTAAARRELERSVAALRTLVESEPMRIGLRRELAASRLELATVLLTGGRAGEAAEVARRARNGLTALLAERPDERRARSWLSRCHGLLAELAERGGDPVRTRAEWRRAAEAIAPLATGSSYHQVLAPWLAALAGLERWDEAREVLDRLRAAGYAGPAVRRAAAHLDSETRSRRRSGETVPSS